MIFAEDDKGHDENIPEAVPEELKGGPSDLEAKSGFNVTTFCF